MPENLNLLENVHIGLEAPSNHGLTNLVKGDYLYYHYLCDGLDDRGWGCGYRTLQTLCSWINKINKNVSVPDIPAIQQTLVKIEDKPNAFLGSRNWIGTVEASMVIDTLYDVPCKIIHVNSGSELNSIVPSLVEHFISKGSPLMMGGDTDCSSKGIMGTHSCDSTNYLLVVDPHYYGGTVNSKTLQSRGWIKWVAVNDFLDSSFYNLCLPQLCSNQ
ncbi:ufm1-specific protease 1 [Chrysoperla carnea]|uniref:ufm1-specific protease 1 n=1 Tax=Chrysoperla carnea TaxID=189513 RepID=UPI001D084781|nr:ufm1-specific protease 1 [Chrysoperla carnea]